MLFFLLNWYWDVVLRQCTVVHDTQFTGEKDVAYAIYVFFVVFKYRHILYTGVIYLEVMTVWRNRYCQSLIQVHRLIWLHRVLQRKENALHLLSNLKAYKCKQLQQMGLILCSHISINMTAALTFTSRSRNLYNLIIYISRIKVSSAWSLWEKLSNEDLFASCTRTRPFTPRFPLRICTYLYSSEPSLRLKSRSALYP